jgi:L-lactate dehydrogenase complex protein LldG
MDDKIAGHSQWLDQTQGYEGVRRQKFSIPMEETVMSARAQLLARISSRLAAQSSAGDRSQKVDGRLSMHRRNTVPARGKKSHAELIELFCTMLTAVQGSVERVKSLQQVPKAISGYLEQNTLGKEVCLDEEAELLGIPWETGSNLEFTAWTAKHSISVGITSCYGAVAETGSLVVCSSSNHAITMNFLAETNIVILDARNLVGVYEEIWDRLRTQSGIQLPRDLTLISGPSCTGDIEMVLEFGVHGPKRLHVIIVGDAVAEYVPAI